MVIFQKYTLLCFSALLALDAEYITLLETMYTSTKYNYNPESKANPYPDLNPNS